jgi:hypothetical protein
MPKKCFSAINMSSTVTVSLLSSVNLPVKVGAKKHKIGCRARKARGSRRAGWTGRGGKCYSLPAEEGAAPPPQKIFNFSIWKCIFVDSEVL